MAYTDPRTWVTAEIVTAAIMNTHIRDNLDAVITSGAVTAESWTPTLEATTTNPDATATGYKYRIGPMQFVGARFVLGSEQGGTGTYFVTLPVAPSGVTAANVHGQAVGSGQAHDVGAAANSELIVPYVADATTVRFILTAGVNVTESGPFIWGTSDVLTFTACYPVA